MAVKADEGKAKDVEDSDESAVGVPNTEAAEAVQQAIVKAEAGDLVGALKLFDHAFNLSPETGSFAMNLAVSVLMMAALT